jgi:hypothetical protein
MSAEWITGSGCAVIIAVLLVSVIWSRRTHARRPRTPATNHGRSKRVGTHAKDDFLNLGSE